MTVVVDSDILIEVSRGKDTALLERWAELTNSNDLVLCSPVTVAELWQGARPHEHEALTRLFRAFSCATIDVKGGQLAGEYLRKYRNSHGLELGDALIASAAATYNAVLWTRNLRHYPLRDFKFY